TQSRRIIPEFAVPVAPDPAGFKERPGSPQFPGNPRDHSPCSPTPARPNPRDGTNCQRIRHGPRVEPRRRLSTIADFGAQSHGIWSGCLRLAVEVARHRARLASGCWSQLYRAGFEPAEFRRKVSESSDPSSFPELRGARFVPSFFAAWSFPMV